MVFSRTLSGRLKSALREPILHFIVVGALLFGSYEHFRTESVAPERKIVISTQRIGNMTEAFIRTWQRPPTQSELTRLIDDYIRTEVFVREAVALGLDRDDVIIRQRLRQKMEFIGVDGSQDREATVQELEDYYQNHVQQYQRQTKITFRQMFLDPNKAGADLDSEVDRLLKRLNGTQAVEDVETIGGGPVLLKPEWRDTDQAVISARFGAEFTRALLRQPLGIWAGALSSAYGAHLVKVDKVQPGEALSLELIHQRVESDWRIDQRKNQQDALYRRLLEKYRIERPVHPKL